VEIIGAGRNATVIFSNMSGTAYPVFDFTGNPQPRIADLAIWINQGTALCGVMFASNNASSNSYRGLIERCILYVGTGGLSVTAKAAIICANTDTSQFNDCIITCGANSGNAIGIYCGQQQLLTGLASAYQTLGSTGNQTYYTVSGTWINASLPISYWTGNAGLYITNGSYLATFNAGNAYHCAVYVYALNNTDVHFAHSRTENQSSDTTFFSLVNDGGGALGGNGFLERFDFEASFHGCNTGNAGAVVFSTGGGGDWNINGDTGDTTQSIAYAGGGKNIERIRGSIPITNATAAPKLSIGATGFTSVGSGGSSYQIGDVLTLVGGTNLFAGQFTVSGVSNGVVTAGSVTYNGSYSVFPGNPISTTGGHGSGCTLNLTSGAGYVDAFEFSTSNWSTTVDFSTFINTYVAKRAVNNDVTVVPLISQQLNSSVQAAHPAGYNAQTNGVVNSVTANSTQQAQMSFLIPAGTLYGTAGAVRRCFNLKIIGSATQALTQFTIQLRQVGGSGSPWVLGTGAAITSGHYQTIDIVITGWTQSNGPYVSVNIYDATQNSTGTLLYFYATTAPYGNFNALANSYIDLMLNPGSSGSSPFWNMTTCFGVVS
jgi:hypothetical protein